MSTVFISRITSIVRSHTTVSANPVYRVTMENGETYQTQSDASINYAIANPEFRDCDVEFTVSRRGRIEHAKPLPAKGFAVWNLDNGEWHNGTDAAPFTRESADRAMAADRAADPDVRLEVRPYPA